MASVEGGPSVLQPTLNAVVGGGQPPSHPASLQLQGGPASEQLISQGLLTIFITLPTLGGKVFLSCDCHFLSHCGSWDVCCWLPWRWPR